MPFVNMNNSKTLEIDKPALQFLSETHRLDRISSSQRSFDKTFLMGKEKFIQLKNEFHFLRFIKSKLHWARAK